MKFSYTDRFFYKRFITHKNIQTQTHQQVFRFSYRTPKNIEIGQYLKQGWYENARQLVRMRHENIETTMHQIRSYIYDALLKSRQRMIRTITRVCVLLGLVINLVGCICKYHVKSSVVCGYQEYVPLLWSVRYEDETLCME